MYFFEKATQKIEKAAFKMQLKKLFIEKLEKEITKLNGMLNNERFVANAPEQVIADNKQALADASEKMAKVE